MFLSSPDYSHWPLNNVWLCLHFAEDALSLRAGSQQLPSTDPPPTLWGDKVVVACHSQKEPGPTQENNQKVMEGGRKQWLGTATWDSRYSTLPSSSCLG